MFYSNKHPCHLPCIRGLAKSLFFAVISTKFAHTVFRWSFGLGTPRFWWRHEQVFRLTRSRRLIATRSIHGFTSRGPIMMIEQRIVLVRATASLSSSKSSAAGRRWQLEPLKQRCLRVSASDLSSPTRPIDCHDSDSGISRRHVPPLPGPDSASDSDSSGVIAAACAAAPQQAQSPGLASCPTRMGSVQIGSSAPCKAGLQCGATAPIGHVNAP